MRWNHELNDVVLGAISDLESWETQVLRAVLPNSEEQLETSYLVIFLEGHSECEGIINAIADSKHSDADFLLAQLFVDAVSMGTFSKVQKFAGRQVKYIAYRYPEIVLPYLKDPSEALGIALCEMFAEVAKKEALDALLGLLDTASERVQVEAIKAMNSLKSREAAPKLLAYMRKQAPNHWQLLNFIADAITLTGNDAIILEAFQDERPEIRETMAKNMGLLNHHSGIMVFLNALEDNSWWVRRVAVDNLGHLGDMSIYPDLLKLRNDPEIHVRKSLIKAVLKIAELEALPDIFLFTQDKSSQVRFELLQAIGRINHPIVLPIADALLADSDKHIRSNAQKLVESYSQK